MCAKMASMDKNQNEMQTLFLKKLWFRALRTRSSQHFKSESHDTEIGKVITSETGLSSPMPDHGMKCDTPYVLDLISTFDREGVICLKYPENDAVNVKNRVELASAFVECRLGEMLTVASAAGCEITRPPPAFIHPLTHLSETGCFQMWG